MKTVIKITERSIFEAKKTSCITLSAECFSLAKLGQRFFITLSCNPDAFGHAIVKPITNNALCVKTTHQMPSRKIGTYKVQGTFSSFLRSLLFGNVASI